MAKTTQLINASPDQVFAVLADGWTYGDWVVGTAHIRAVESGWPEPGTKIHHKAGPWPVSLRDHTTSLESQPGTLLLLKVRLWPLGAGRVRFDLEPAGHGATRVTLTEEFVEGPLLGLRNKINDVVLHYRNRESLRRLADLAVGRAAGRLPEAAHGPADPVKPAHRGE
jgi:hypothetical protein